MAVRVVTQTGEQELQGINLPVPATDADILKAVERFLDQPLEGYMVTRNPQSGDLLVSPTPVYG